MPKLRLKNIANTVVSFLSNAATVAREWTLPDRSGTVALLDDLDGTVDELTEIAGVTLESDITASQLLTALAIPMRIAIHADAGTGLTLSNMTNAVAVLPLNTSLHYTVVNTVGLRRMRLLARVNTTSNSTNNPRMYIQYSINGGGAWITLGAGTIASGDAISLFTGAAAVQYTNWITIPSEAIGDAFLWRIATEGGDGAADPVVGNVTIEATT